MFGEGEGEEMMAREGLMDDCGYYGFDECARYEECCDEAYERGRADAIEEIANKSFCEWTNCEDCAMWGQYDEFGEEEVCILEQLKEQNK